MLIGCSSHSFRCFAIDQFVEATSAAGLDAIELVLRPHPWQVEDFSLPDQREIARWQASLDRHKIRIAAVNITSGDPTDSKVIALCMAKLSIAQRLGATVVIAPAGEPRNSAQRRELFDHLHRLADAAGEREMTLALDTVAGLCEDARSMIKTCGELDHPAVKICFDTGRYLTLGGDVSGEIALLRTVGHVAVVRLTDTAGVPGAAHFPSLGSGGCVDFARTLEILRGANFTGPCLIDFSPRQRRPASLRQHQVWLDESFALLRCCGWFD